MSAHTPGTSRCPATRTVGPTAIASAAAAREDQEPEAATNTTPQRDHAEDEHDEQRDTQVSPRLGELDPGPVREVVKDGLAAWRPESDRPRRKEEVRQVEAVLRGVGSHRWPGAAAERVHEVRRHDHRRGEVGECRVPRQLRQPPARVEKQEPRGRSR